MSGIPFLGPWIDRLDEQAFFANGRRFAFDMQLGNIRGEMPSHGFLTTTDRWNVVEAKADAEGAWVTSRLEFYRQPMWMKQWPFAHTIEITYRLHDGVLEVETTIVNMSAEPMPIAIGFHPYFQLTDSPRDAWTLSVGARTHWLLTSNKRADRRDRADRTVFPDSTGRAARRLQPRRCVHRSGARRAGPSDDRRDWQIAAPRHRVGPNYRAVTIWSPKERPFICVEPTAGIINALNLAARGLYKELQSVAPGGTWRERFWIKPSGF